jgi:aconitase B
MEDIGGGSEAIRFLETNVKATLRMIDNVYEKSRYLEKENTKLDTRVYDLELINQSFKDRMNKSFVQRLLEPVLSCGVHQANQPAKSANTVTRHYDNREMSHLLPPEQASMHSDPDLH